MLQIDVCLSPKLLDLYEKIDHIVVADVWRASTTILSMLYHGAKKVYPLENLEIAEKYSLEGKLVGAERNAQVCSFTSLGNSPLQYTSKVVKDKDIYFTTTNGTKALYSALMTNAKVWLGSFANLPALAQSLSSLEDQTIIVLAAGWKERFSLEDSLFGGALCVELSKKTDTSFITDSGKMMSELWNRYADNPLQLLKRADHYKRLQALGLVHEAELCLEIGRYNIVPTCSIENEQLVIKQQ